MYSNERITHPLLCLAIAALIFYSVCEADANLRKGFRQDTNYAVSWEVVEADGVPSIIFDVIANTNGWVGIGVNHQPLMDGADLSIVAVDEDNRFYNGDYYGVGNTPVRDRNGGLDWYLAASITENSTSTSVKFMRRLFTNDEDDIEIKDEDIYLLWSYGENDNVTQMHKERGYFSVNLLQEIGWLSIV